ncbi:hypothetical protein [Lonsdalea britannica]|uniref:hypothetical protein n=1 Tax=Lonsdalea britannica TaxID=1082704 RepID=UPI0026EDACC5|nr:hypothetical protein [Lonsdalea britannica]
MTAGEFNRRYPIGASFIYESLMEPKEKRAVKTIDIARDFDCGVIVEINLLPYFVKLESLTPAA